MSQNENVLSFSFICLVLFCCCFLSSCFAFSFVLFCLGLGLVKLRFDTSKTGKTEGMLQVDTVSQRATVHFNTLSGHIIISVFLTMIPK